MKAEGKLLHEGQNNKGDEVFVFYGYNPHNGEPHHPMEIRVKANSPDVEYLKDQCGKDVVTLEVNRK